MKRHQGGITLIEILVALLILSIGLLGLANLQAVGLRANHNAYLRSQATFLAYDIVDRMRANRPPALSGSYDIALDDTPAGSGVPANDLDEWKTLLAGRLPSGDGLIDVTDGVVTVVVEWDDSRGEDTPIQMTITSEL
jgi:type IV pilus assembly protein PilV